MEMNDAHSYRNIDITIDGMCVLIRLILCSVQAFKLGYHSLRMACVSLSARRGDI